MIRNVRHRAYEIIESTRDDDIAGLLVNRIIIIFICLNIAAIIAEYFEDLRGSVVLFLRVFEYLSVALVQP
jgi:hypothetical protein